MSDDLSLFDRRMRKPAAISVVGGVMLGVLSVQSQRFVAGAETPWLLAIPLSILAATALYGVTYKNLAQRLEHESQS